MFKNIIKYLLITIVFISSLLTCVITIGSACSYCNGTKNASADELPFSDCFFNFLPYPYHYMVPQSYFDKVVTVSVLSDGSISVDFTDDAEFAEFSDEYLSYTLSTSLDLESGKSYYFYDLSFNYNFLSLCYFDSLTQETIYATDSIVWQETYSFISLNIEIWLVERIDNIILPYFSSEELFYWTPPIELLENYCNERYEDGFVNGLIEGKDEGYSDGFEGGVSVGYNDGYEDGYDAGFNIASVGKDFTAESFFTKVLSILDVKLFGFVSIADIMKIIVSAGLVILALKMFTGG